MKVKATDKKIPGNFVYNEELDKLKGKVFFPEKVKKAEEILRKYPPPTSLFK